MAVLDIDKLILEVLTQEKHIVYPLPFSVLQTVVEGRVSHLKNKYSKLKSDDLKIIEEALMQIFFSENMNGIEKKKKELMDLQQSRLFDIVTTSTDIYDHFIYEINNHLDSLESDSHIFYSTYCNEPNFQKILQEISQEIILNDFFRAFVDYISVQEENSSAIFTVLSSYFTLSEYSIYKYLENLPQLAIDDQALIFYEGIENFKHEASNHILSDLKITNLAFIDFKVTQAIKIYTDAWEKVRAAHKLKQNEEFYKKTKINIKKIFSRQISLFDCSICSSNLLFFEIILAAAPTEFHLPDYVFESLIGMLANGIYNSLHDLQFRQTQNLDGLLRSFFNETNSECKDFYLLCLFIVMADLSPLVFNPRHKWKFSPIHRKWLYNVFTLIYEISNPQKLIFYRNSEDWKKMQLIEKAILEEFENFSCFKCNLAIDKKQKIMKSSSQSILSWISGLVSNVDEHKFDFKTILPKDSLTATVAISGWLSFDDNHEKKWSHLLQMNGTSEVMSLLWSSSTSMSFASSTVLSSFNMAKNVITRKYYMALLEFARLVTSTNFETSRKNAKVAGRELANAIIHMDYFKQRPVTLVAFSLGACVVQSCLKELSRKGAYVDKVVLLGGAVSNDSKKWSLCKKAVLGRFINVYCENDSVLKIFYKIATRKQAIGLSEINIQGIENFNVTDLLKGHLDYRDNLDKVFLHIDFLKMF